MKRFLALVMAAMMLAATACTAAPAGNTTTAEPTTAAEPATTTSPTEEPTTEEPAAPSGETTMEAASAAEVSGKDVIHIFGSRGTNGPEDFNEMPLVQQWSDAVNVQFEWELVATGYADVKALKLASGDFPDVFMTVTNEEIIKYGSEGVFIPLQDLQAQHAPNLQQIFSEHPEYKAFMTAPDGNIYTFFRLDGGPWSGINRLQVINTDWLEAAGLSMPTSLAELKDALIAFRDQDVNGNGDPNDEIPMSWAGSLSGFHPMGWAFAPDFTAASFSSPIPYADDHMGYRDDRVYFIPVQEEYKNWVRWMGELYAEGLLDPQGFTQGTDQYAAKINTTPYTLGVVSVWDIGDSFTDPAASEQYDFLPPLKGLNGEDPVIQYNFGYGNRERWAVTTACENPEAVVRAADYCYDLDVTVQFLEGPYDVRLIPCHCGVEGAYEAGPPPEGMDNTSFRDSVAIFGSTPAYITLDGYAQRLHLHYTDNKVEYMNTVMDPFKDPDPMPPFFMSTEETETKNMVWTDICEYVNRRGAEMVINNSVDADWDAYVSDLEGLGYPDVVAAQQAAVDRGKSAQ